jgi:hypothetical protein
VRCVCVVCVCVKGRGGRDVRCVYVCVCCNRKGNQVLCLNECLQWEASHVARSIVEWEIKSFVFINLASTNACNGKRVT